jgi:hypothetical protein
VAPCLPVPRLCVDPTDTEFRYSTSTRFRRRFDRGAREPGKCIGATREWNGQFRKLQPGDAGDAPGHLGTDR